jgi:hypothetical protein
MPDAHRRKVVLVAAFLICGTVFAIAQDAAPVIAEHAFAARAAEIGVAPSFLEFMADDAVIFSPDPVNAKAFYGARPAAKPPRDGGPLLAWWPNFAGIARSGDLGFTTGPATVNGGPVRVFYFTVWRKLPDGKWKWVFDGGAPAKNVAAPGPQAAPVILPAGDAEPMPVAAALAQVRQAEAEIARRARDDAAAAITERLSMDARVQGSLQGPATNTDAITAELGRRAKVIAFTPIGPGLSSSAGDMVWTYGDARWGEGRGHYTRIWQRRAGRWQHVFDQLLTLKAP